MLYFNVLLVDIQDGFYTPENLVIELNGRGFNVDNLNHPVSLISFYSYLARKTSNNLPAVVILGLMQTQNDSWLKYVKAIRNISEIPIYKSIASNWYPKIIILCESSREFRKIADKYDLLNFDGKRVSCGSRHYQDEISKLINLL